MIKSPLNICKKINISLNYKISLCSVFLMANIVTRKYFLLTFQNCMINCFGWPFQDCIKMKGFLCWEISKIAFVKCFYKSLFDLSWFFFKFWKSQNIVHIIVNSDSYLNYSASTIILNSNLRRHCCDCWD